MSEHIVDEDGTTWDRLRNADVRFIEGCVYMRRPVSAERQAAPVFVPRQVQHLGLFNARRGDVPELGVRLEERDGVLCLVLRS